MSKTITCDFCQKTLDLKGYTRKPDGWGRLNFDHRLSSNIGGAVLRLDACDDCDKDLRKLLKKEIAITFVKALKEVEAERNAEIRV